MNLERTFQKVDESLAKLIKPLREQHKVLSEAEEDAKAQVAALRDRRLSVERTLRNLDPEFAEAEQAKAKARTKNNGSGDLFSYGSAPTLRTVYEAVLNADGPASASDLTEATGLSRSSVDKGVQGLRNAEYVRLAGKDGMAYMYAPMPGAPAPADAFPEAE